METHARLLAYADTVQNRHPLILVVGREASRDAALVDGVGGYDFDSVTSNFWNTAYSTLATVGGSNLNKLRADCRQRRSSPIVFADALPVGIDNGNDTKLALRDQVTVEQLDAHLKALLQMQIINRVKLIVCAGHREGTRGSPVAENLFERAFNSIQMYASEVSVHLAETPAMLAFNSKVIRDRLTKVNDGSDSAIGKIFEEFNRSHNTMDNV